MHLHQASILLFFARGDLARFATVSKECRDVATMGSLWLPLLLLHVGNVVPPTPLLLLSPARCFCTLALTPCSVCNENIASFGAESRSGVEPLLGTSILWLLWNVVLRDMPLPVQMPQ